MTNARDVDSGLFGLWPKEPAYDGFARQTADLETLFAPEVARILLETKSGEEPEPDLHDLMNQLTRELAEQFRAFRTLRTEAEKLLAASEDEAAIKLAKADIKAATDAISLIVRTLEKLDSLQRSLAHDRALEAERNFDAAGYDAAKRELLALVDARAEERALALFESWKAASLADGDATAARPPPD